MISVFLVMTPVRDGDLCRAVQSVLMQTGVEFELLLAGQASALNHRIEHIPGASAVRMLDYDDSPSVPLLKDRILAEARGRFLMELRPHQYFLPSRLSQLEAAWSSKCGSIASRTVLVGTTAVRVSDEPEWIAADHPLTRGAAGYAVMTEVDFIRRAGGLQAEDVWTRIANNNGLRYVCRRPSLCSNV